MQRMASIQSMQLRSPDFENKEMIPTRYTCEGENISPELDIQGVPEAAKSLALLVDDPDAPSGTWTHWLVWNFEPHTVRIPAGHVPAGGVEGTTSFGKSGYGGPCPPSGIHRYFFKLFALDVELDLSTESRVEEFIKAIDGHVLAQAELIGLYSRNGV